MKFAIIKASGTQYQVEEGSELLVDRISSNEGDTVSFDVILYVDDAITDVGSPTVSNSSVTAQVLGHERGDKLRVATYKAKSRQRRVTGYRHDYTRIKIHKINHGKN